MGSIAMLLNMYHEMCQTCSFYVNKILKIFLKETNLIPRGNKIRKMEKIERKADERKEPPRSAFSYKMSL